MLDPTVGVWMTEDPIGFEAGDPNLRRYVGNNATNGTDRNGLDDEEVGEPKGYWYDRIPIGLVISVGDIRRATTRAGAAYKVSRGTGSSVARSAANSGVVIAADATGVGEIEEAYEGKKLFTGGPLSTGERVVKGTVGSVKVVGTAIGIRGASSRIPLPSLGRGPTTGVLIGKPPKGAKIVQTDPNGKWVIFEDTTGVKKIQFDVTVAEPVARLPLKPGRGSPETEAMVGPDGKIMVLEGMHRLVGAKAGSTIPVGKGGIKGKPGWLEYDLSTRRK